MSFYHIHGGNRLTGEIQVQGAKNSVLPLLAGAILAKGETVIHNCPALSDVSHTMDILSLLGCQVKREGSTVIVDSTALNTWEIPCEKMQEMRSSVLFLGALLGRLGKAQVCSPGGCQLGPRPIDIHLSAFTQLGVSVVQRGDDLTCTSTAMTQGKEICLSFPSVGATENIMLAACGFSGVTTIVGAAREPEIVDLQEFLCSMGAKIHGAGTTVIQIEGGSTLRPTEFTVMGDRIVACTYLSAAAVTGGTVSLTGVSAQVMTSVLSTFSQMGCCLSTRKSAITLATSQRLQGISPLRTAPYPGFPTDCQALLMATLATSCGSTMLEENVFDSRYHHVDELRRMGASIEISSRVALVKGVSQLQGATVQGRDLRGAAALVVASLGAKGESRVYGLSHLQRGYESLETDLRNMGAEIELRS
ncbi:MAG: UDP-N-acetylglucosamine 1-carboxyvinyltransferase [Eubacteriales bacterium]